MVVTQQISDYEKRKSDFGRVRALKKFYPAIEQANVVLVYSPDGHIGEHTQRDIDYAMKCGKSIILFPSPQLILADKQKEPKE